MNGEGCGRCRYWLDGDGDLEPVAGIPRGVCRRMPPAVRVEESARHPLGVYPQTLATQWCGEFRFRASAAGGHPREDAA